jgi:pimeloyl-ACP methyl ester carboxylesterase
MADAACRRNLAALALDLPGYGESHMRGTRLEGPESLRDAATAAYRFVANRGLERSAVLGVSLDGLLAHAFAAFEPHFKASVGLGGPANLAWLWTHVPYAQARRFTLACGNTPWRDVARRLDPSEILASGHAPALILHGERDEVVPLSDGHRLARIMGKRAILRIVPGADHLAGPRLHEETERAIDWLANQLAG